MKIGDKWPDGSFSVELDGITIKLIIESALKEYVMNHTDAKRITSWYGLGSWSMPRDGGPSKIRFGCISEETE